MKSRIEIEETKPLRADEEDSEVGSDSWQPPSNASHRRPSRGVCILSVAYLVLVVLYGVLLVAFLGRNGQTSDAGIFPSLASSGLYRTGWKHLKFTVAGSPFTGHPKPSVDEAWHDLLENTVVRVSKEDLDYFNVTSLPLSDGGYASELFLTHELHCLYIWRDYYYSDVKGVAAIELRQHVDHCIETLRQTIMCRGSLSLATYTYWEGSHNVTARSWGPHECVDWDALREWMQERSVDIFAPGVLVDPEHLDSVHFSPIEPIIPVHHDD